MEWAEWEAEEWEVVVCHQEWEEVHQWEEEWEMEEEVNLRKDNHSGKVGSRDQARTLVQAVEVQDLVNQAVNIKEQKQMVKEEKAVAVAWADKAAKATAVKVVVVVEVIHLAIYLKQTEE